MKKIISIVLAAIMAFTTVAISASALTGGDYQTYHIEFTSPDKHLHAEPIPGYSQYVNPGDDFKFIVYADEGYGEAFILVEVDGTRIYPDMHDIYTISDINSDKTVKVFLQLNNNSTNMFASLITLVHDILAWIKNIFEEITKGLAK